MRRHPLHPIGSLVLALSGGLVGFVVAGTLNGWLGTNDTGFAAATETALWAMGGAMFGMGLGLGVSRRVGGRGLAAASLVGILLALTAAILVRQRMRATRAARLVSDPVVARPRPALVVPLPTDTLPPPLPEVDSIIGLAPLAGPEWTGGLPASLVIQRRDAGPGTRPITLDDLEHAELGYDAPALVVRGMRERWLLVATTAGGRGWVRAPHHSSMVPLTEVLPRALTYLTGAWNREVADAPGGAATRVAGIDPGEDETPATVHEARLVDGTLWLDVSVFAYSPCEGDSDPPRIARGWVPAWTGGAPTAWYYSRGC
jgi:hypothetical protein